MKSNVVIIGAGPSGVACAIQLKRFGIEPILFEKAEIGGLLKNANFVENYPGFPQGIKGSNLITLLKRHLKVSNIKVNFEEVVEVAYHKKRFHIRTNKQKITCPILVIASGTEPKKLNIPISQDCARRILYEVYPIKDRTNKKIGIIGSGDAAFDYALSLSSKNRVVILNRSDRLKCLPVLWKRSRSATTLGGQTGIKYCAKTIVRQIVKKNEKLLLSLSHKKEQLYLDYLLIAIGRRPCLNFLSAGLRKRLKELVKKKILYIIGDARNGIYRQAAIAVGDGVRTAMEIGKRILYENNR